MKPLGFFRATGLIAAKDLRLEWRTWESISSSLVFSLIVLVVFNFAFGLDAVRELGAVKMMPGAIWTILAFAAVVTLARSSQIERQDDALGALFLTPVDRGALYLGKAVANGIKLSVLMTLLVPLSAMMFQYDLGGSLLPLSGVLLVHGLGLVELGTLFAAVTTRVGRSEALLVTLLFPAATPLLISAVKCTAAVVGGRQLAGYRDWLLLAAGFDVLYLLVALLTYELVMEE